MPENRLFDQDKTNDQDSPESRPVGASRPPDAYPSLDEPVALPPEDDEALLDGGRYVRIAPPGSSLRRIIVVSGSLVVIAGLLVGSAGLWLQRQITPPGGPGEAIEFTIPSRATVDEVVSLLAGEGVVTNPTVFRYYLRWKGVDAFLAGDYTLAKNSSFGDVIATLEAGPAPIRTERFTVPEGLTIDEIAARLDEQIDGFDADDMRPALIRMETDWRPTGIDEWEGLLFPDTYDYFGNDEPLAILQRMNTQFDSVARSVGLSPLMNFDPATMQPTGLTAYQYIIIASMIEKEARLSEEHALMSRVIHNRIELGMMLGIDATVIYARGPERTGPLTDADLAIDSPYNTRLNPGLPPTPIAAPGRSALDAALNPADGPWLYYVLSGEDGSHFFTDDYDEFLRVRDESRARGLF